MFLSYLISIEGELGCTGNHCSLPHTGESCCVLPASTAAASQGRGSPCSGCGAVTFLLPQHKAPVPAEHHPLVAQRLQTSATRCAGRLQLLPAQEEDGSSSPYLSPSLS